MLQRFGFQRVLDLAPPVATTFQRDKVLPDREVFLLEGLVEFSGERRAVLARIGNERSGLWLASHMGFPVLARSA